MLQRLIIRDFVIVDALDCAFSPGFGALTGETGAGKSILIDALALALGERADVSAVRQGADKADIGASFAVAGLPQVAAWMADNDFALEYDEILLRRIVEKNGRSRAYINGAPATAQQLREVSEFLLDIHGQHAHQSLLRGEAQRQLLDVHGGHGELAQQVAETWRQLQQTQAALAQAQTQSQALRREREQLGWQVEELSALNLQAGEWSSLQREQQRLAHAVSLVEGAHFALEVLSEGENTGLSLIHAAEGRLDGLAAIDPTLLEAGSLLASARVEIEEAVSLLRRYADNVDQDPERLEALERRMESALNCARKYRVTPDDLPDLLVESSAALAKLDAAVDAGQLLAQLAEAEKRYASLATELSAKRVETARILGQAVTDLMAELALGRGQFAVALVACPEGSAAGYEQVEFRVGGLAGDEMRPMAKVVSGGELSRISLALQVVTSRSASVPTLIFDEVDVGIGGGVAEIVGRMLFALGQERQVLCVTHLPQVAARANWQWRVSKSSNTEGVVTSRVDALDAAGRVEEIARMLGGVEITETTRRHAQEMLGV